MIGPRICSNKACGAPFDPNGHSGKAYTYCPKCRRLYREGVTPGEKSDPALELKAALNRAQRALDAEKSRTAALVEATYQGARDAMAALTIPLVPRPKPTSALEGTPETAIAILADWQLGKKTPTYSTAICEKRIEEYGDKVHRLAEIQRSHHPVRELRVYLLGDLVEGELIFPGQAHRIDISLFRQVLTDGPRILANFLRKMAHTFEKVHVVGVIGNHGRIGGREARDYHPETNADAMMYEVTRLVVSQESRISWAPNLIEGERRWYAVDKIGDKGYFLFHGDQVKGGFAGFPWYGFSKKILGWANGGVPERFHYALSGHFHTPVRGLYGQITHWGSGSTESDNTYAQEFFSCTGRPSQWLLFAHPKLGVTSEFEVHLV